MSITGMNLFPHPNELLIPYYETTGHLSILIDRTNSMSFLVPWSLLTKISITYNITVIVDQLEAILRSANNVHTLEFRFDRDIFTLTILRKNQYRCTKFQSTS
jgi:hypothetical protein